MRKAILLLTLFLLCSLYGIEKEWAPYGTPIPTPPYAQSYNLILDNTNKPIIAFNNAYLVTYPPTTPYMENGPTSVLSFNGEEWVLIGEEHLPSSALTDKSLLLGDDGKIFIINENSVLSYDGTEWKTVGNTIFTDEPVFSPTLAISNNGTLFVAFTTTQYKKFRTVMTFNGTE